MVIPVDSKWSGAKLRHSVLAADDFAESIIIKDPLLGHIGQSGDIRLVAAPEHTDSAGFGMAQSGPALAREVSSAGSGGMALIKAQVMAKDADRYYYTLVDKDHSEPGPAPEAAKVILVEIMIGNWK